MKKASLPLMFCAALLLSGCHKNDPSGETYDSKDIVLEGVKVDVSTFSSGIKKVFILNEGSMGANNATLDMVRVTDGSLVNGVFKKMNPKVAGGLGDTGNDIAVCGDEVWIVVNGSGIVEVISAVDESEIAAIEIPTPRNVAFDDKYAYVTSWAKAYATGAYDDMGNYSISDYSNPKGVVYRISLENKKVDGYVEVGYQPEGLACYEGKLYVANSGGISSQLPPDYAYDKTVSVIDTKTFTLSSTIDVEVNLHSVLSDGKGNIYVTSFGNFYDIHSGIYRIDAGGKGALEKIGEYVSAAALDGDALYWIGAEEEFDWTKTNTWKGGMYKGGTKSQWSTNIDGTAIYSLAAMGNDTFLVGDAGDYFNPGTLACYHGKDKLWIESAGVCPGHIAVW